MGFEEIRASISYLATDRKIAASTQNIALSALLLLYRQVLKVDSKLSIYLHGTQYFSVSLTPSLLGSKIEAIRQNLWKTV